MYDDEESYQRSLDRANAAAQKKAAIEEGERWDKTFKEIGRRHAIARESARMGYFYSCADVINETTPYTKMDATDLAAVANGLEYIHEQGLKSDWFRAEWAKEARMRNSREGGSAGINADERRKFFREKFFEPFLVQNLMGQGAELAHDFDLGREWARQRGKRLNTAYYVYRCAIYNVLEFLGVERHVEDASYERIDRWDKVCKELRGLKQGEKEPAEPVYPLDPKKVLECANRWDRTIDVNFSVIAGPSRELWHVGKITAEKTEERPGLEHKKAKQRIF